jgi:hypothetical protein
MKEQITHIHISKQKCISFDTMQAYLRSELSKEEIRRVEEHLASCEFCSDALDGFLEAENYPYHFEKVVLLQKKISDRKVKRLLISGNASKVWLYTAVAASIALLIGVSIIFRPKTENTLALNKVEDAKISESLPAATIEVLPELSSENDDLAKIVEENINPSGKVERVNPLVVKEKTTVKEEHSNLVANEILIEPEEGIESEVTSELEVYQAENIEATRNMGNAKNNMQTGTTHLNNSENLLKLLNEKIAQKDYTSSLNILYQLENGPDAANYKQKVVLTRARIFAEQYNKAMGINYLQSVSDPKIINSPEYKTLLDSLSK